MREVGFRYVEGHATMVAGPRLAVVVPLATDDALIGELLNLVVVSGANSDDVLDVLLRPGLRSMSSFAVCETSEKAVRVLLRGEFKAHATGVGSLTARSPWSDETVPADSEVRISLCDEAAKLPTTMRLIHGVARMAALRAMVSADAAAEPLGLAERGVSEARRSAGPGAPPTITAPSSPNPVPARGLDADDEDFDEGALDYLHIGELNEDAEPDESAVITDPTLRPKMSGKMNELRLGHTLPVVSTGDLPDLVPSPPPPPESILPFGPPRFIESVPWAPEDDIPRPRGPEPSLGRPSRPGNGLPPDSLIGQIGPNLQISRVSAPRVPKAASKPPTLSMARSDYRPNIPLPHSAKADSHDVDPAMPLENTEALAAPLPGRQRGDMIVSRTNLRPNSGSGPQIIATACPQGHFNAPYAGSCRVCAAPIPPQKPVLVPRPPLGMLRLSNGGSVVLDRAAIIGRNPRVPLNYTGEQPNLVQVPDPERDISSQHLEVRLDEWHVAVKDLGSTNGTQVLLPGEPPVTLRPNDPMIIEPGTRVVLAGVFDFVFEVPR